MIYIWLNAMMRYNVPNIYPPNPSHRKLLPNIKSNPAKEKCNVVVKL